MIHEELVSAFLFFFLSVAVLLLLLLFFLLLLLLLSCLFFFFSGVFVHPLPFPTTTASLRTPKKTDYWVCSGGYVADDVAGDVADDVAGDVADDAPAAVSILHVNTL
uniref:Uncharacterized protein n=1 Tax=Lotharella globosa TaxID=91324 RepID=A0A7S3YUP0_9EUKA